MPATDVPSLLANANVACYNNYSSDQQLIKLALLQAIVQAIAPGTPTDPQSLLSNANVNCYRSFGSWPLLELALSQIIAQNAANL